MDSDFQSETENRAEFPGSSLHTTENAPAELSVPTKSEPVELGSSPVQISDQFWRLDRRNVQVERISGLIFASILMAVVLTTVIVFWFILGLNWLWYTVAGVALALTAASFLFAIFWPSMSYKHASWRLDREGLEIRQGVLFRHWITVPLGRVQHADVSQGPLQRQFDIGTLTVHTAGTQHASIPLQGLAHTTAIELRDLIVQQKKDQHAV